MPSRDPVTGENGSVKWAKDIYINP